MFLYNNLLSVFVVWEVGGFFKKEKHHNLSVLQKVEFISTLLFDNFAELNFEPKYVL